MKSSWSRLALRLVARASCFGASAASATPADDVGATALRAFLGPAAPTGAGVAAAQIEGPLAAPNPPNYLPQFGTNPIAGTGIFAGKTFTDRTESPSDTDFSSHARTVGTFFYGIMQSSSLSYGLSEIDAFRNDHYLEDGFLAPTALNRAPALATWQVENHSWIGSGTNDTLRRFDFALDRDETLAFVGLNNWNDPTAQPTPPPIPDLMASAFNAVSVGRTDGGHSRGTTPAHLDGPGRIKPELVAPLDRTSWTTAYCSSAAALLVDAADGAPSLVNALRLEPMKAILLAGATKSEFPAWQRTQQQPLDLVFGAGEVSVWHSYAILTAGEQESGSAAGATGWDYGESDPNVERRYPFTIPEGFRGAELSAILTWNRTVTDTGPGFAFIPLHEMADLDLRLVRIPDSGPEQTVDLSQSAGDNVEHIRQLDLSPGEYALAVTGDEARDYGLAWRTSLVPDNHTELDIVAFEIDQSAGTATLQFKALPGAVYAAELSTDLLAWNQIPGFSQLVTSGYEIAIVIPLASAPNRQFLRLAEAVPAP